MSEETLYLGMSMKVWIAVVAVLLLVAAVVAVVLATPAGKSLVAPGPGPAPSTGFPLPTQPAGPVGPSPAPVSGAVIPPVVVVQPPAPAPAPGGLVEQAQGMGAGIIAAIVVAALVLAIFLFMGGKKAVRGVAGVVKLRKLQKGATEGEKRAAVRTGTLFERDRINIVDSYNELNLFGNKEIPKTEMENMINAVYLMNKWGYEGVFKRLGYVDNIESNVKMAEAKYKILLNDLLYKDKDWKQKTMAFFGQAKNVVNWKSEILQVLAVGSVLYAKSSYKDKDIFFLTCETISRILSVKAQRVERYQGKIGEILPGKKVYKKVKLANLVRVENEPLMNPQV